MSRRGNLTPSLALFFPPLSYTCEHALLISQRRCLNISCDIVCLCHKLSVPKPKFFARSRITPLIRKTTHNRAIFYSITASQQCRRDKRGLFISLFQKIKQLPICLLCFFLSACTNNVLTHSFTSVCRHTQSVKRK